MHLTKTPTTVHFLIVVAILLISAKPAFAQACYDRVVGVSCCANSSPPPPCATCPAAPGGCCASDIVNDPNTNIVAPGSWHTNPAAWPALAPNTCTYLPYSCVSAPVPCLAGPKNLTTTCPDCGPTTWLKWCPAFP